MITDNRQRINSRIGAQAAFNRKSDRLLDQLRSGELTTEEYEAKLNEARERLDEALEEIPR